MTLLSSMHSAISTNPKHMESMALNMESLGRIKVRCVHRGIRTVSAAAPA